MRPMAFCAGYGSAARVAHLLGAAGARRALVVCGGSSLAASGADRLVVDVLRQRFDVDVHQGAGGLLTQEQVERCRDRVAAFEPDGAVFIGGGSVLDAGKTAVFAWRHAMSIQAVMDGDTEPDAASLRPVLTVAVPTTAGSGSEVTRFTVMYRGGRKVSVAREGMLPDAVVLDPALLRSLPRSVIVSAGLDALAQAVESWWSVPATGESRAYARAAIALARHALEPAAGGDEKALVRMQMAACLAGQAIDRTRTTACHAISYGLTAGYGVPHGVAVALTLPAMFRYNYGVGPDDCTAPAGAAAVRVGLEELARLLGGRDVEEAAGGLETLFDRLGVARRLRAHGVEPAAVPDRLVRGVNPERAGNNPRRLTASALEEMLGGMV